ncbi:ABC-2 family transporter protein [Lactobacillus sp. R2/2]|nr:ABC-2 family transporter protein [Lactobacillus sp. R2/2]
MTKTGVSDNIGEEVKDGSISMRLLKPINFVDTYLLVKLV